MHAIDHTEAIILRTEPAGEANKRVWLFTRVFGLVIATAQGVRKSSAKLKYHLVDYSFVSVDIVQGKHSWRLTGIELLDRVIRGAERMPLARAYVRTLNFLERFLVGDGPQEELFAHLMECIAIVEEGNVEAKAFDAFSLWKMLVILGYIAVEKSDQVLMTLPLRDTLLMLDEKKIQTLIKSATSGITSSHL